MKRSEFFSAAAKEGGKAALQLFEGWGEAVAAFQRETRRPPARPLTGWVRPPGALPEPRFLSACTKCGDCVKACPPLVLKKAGPECGERVGGTPVIVPRENPCRLCDGLPCVAACAAGALVMPAARPRLGTARVDALLCYMTSGQPCDYCVKACPEKPKAIRADLPGTPASVGAAGCTGCGSCVQICPTEAVRIEALS